MPKMPSAGYPLLKRAGLGAGLILFLLVLCLPTPAAMTPEGRKVLATGLLMATWWITECIPIPATALLPLVLFPAMGVMSMQDASAPVGDANVLLFAGGFFIAMAMQKWNLHKRIALLIVRALGVNPHRMVLGFMLATAFLSMWISNTATAMMIFPIGMSVLARLEERGDPDQTRRFAISLMLGIAYAASIGGLATLIGTPPNIVLAAQMRSLYPDAPNIGFLQWMFVGVPLAAIMLPVTWLLLTRVMYRLPRYAFATNTAAIDEELARLGRINRGERIVLAVFLLTALAWATREDLALGALTLPGWARLFPVPAYVHDGTVAIFFALVLFATPVDLKSGEFALDWRSALRIPWGILLLFGGGLALAKGFKDSGLIEWLGARLDVLSGFSPLFMILCVALLLTFLTEVTSNTATTTVTLPILAATASQALHVHPLLLMFPATISASLAFMLPVATPPNAIVFSSERFTVTDMARTGFVLNLIGAILVTLTTYFLAAPVFGITLGELPAWAK